MSSTYMKPQQTHTAVISKGIRGRLFMGFGAVIGIIIIAISLILYKMTVVESFSTTVIETDLPTHDTFYDLTIQIYQSQLALSNWLLTHDANNQTLFANTWKITDKKIETINLYSDNWSNKDDVNKWQNIKLLLGQLKKEQFELINSKTENSAVLSTTILPLLNKFFDIVDGPTNESGERAGGLFDVQYLQLQLNSKEIINDMNTIRNIEYVLLLTCIFVSVFIALYTARGFINYVNSFRQQSSRVAAGDLRQRIEVLGSDEMGQLGNDLNIMTDSLATITKQITEACHNMVTTIEEVTHSVNIQSSGATEQASSINQITASLEEIEKSSTQTIDKAKALGEVAERTREKGQLGLEAVEQSVLGMKSVRDKVQTIAQTILDLSNQTQQVGEITAVVNTLAQQSKMLALNASIEAAKAGESGKGFAVVASEVKNLAEQSEQSTTQVQKILEDIRRATEKAVMATEEGTKGVDQGTVMVEETGDIVKSLSEVIHETMIASQQIEAAIRQEGVGIEQITAGMNEINQVTASFVDSVKQTTEAIDNLAGLVKTLKQYTDVYKL